MLYIKVLDTQASPLQCAGQPESQDASSTTQVVPGLFTDTSETPSPDTPCTALEVPLEALLEAMG